MHLFFSTPIWVSKIDNHEDLNVDMLSYINNLRNKDPQGIIKSNFNGWHSKNFNLKEDMPAKFISSISKNINTALNDMGWDLTSQFIKITNMWSIINEEGAFNQKHHHSNSDLSAAYYVTAKDGCGDIIFYDPRPGKVYKHPLSNKLNLLNAHNNGVRPEPGMLVLFPSYLEHSVNPNTSNHERIVISFNISLEKK